MTGWIDARHRCDEPHGIVARASYPRFPTARAGMPCATLQRKEKCQVEKVKNRSTRRNRRMVRLLSRVRSPISRSSAGPHLVSGELRPTVRPQQVDAGRSDHGFDDGETVANRTEPTRYARLLPRYPARG